MDEHSSPPSLRLVAGEGSEAWSRRARAERDVAMENRGAAATRLDPSDPRWVIAAHARAQLQGALLTPDRRRRVLDRARQLGLRSFEANVIMAIVQDHARRGVPLSDMQTTLAMLPRPRERGAAAAWLSLAAAAGCAVVGALLLIQWVTAA